METCLNWCGDRVFVSTDDRALITKCLSGIKRFPGECEIIALPAENDGTLYFSCPVSFGKKAIRNLFPQKREPMSADRRAEAAARLAVARKKKKEVTNDDGSRE